MDSNACPHLGATDSHNRRIPHVDYPSFENQCFVSGAPDVIMLGDQAAYCLSGGAQHCPRFSADDSHRSASMGFVPLYATAEEAWQETALGAEADLFDAFAADDEDDGGRRRWAWLGAGIMFVTVFLCGAMVTTYTGWQWVTRRLPDPVTAGRVNTLAADAIATPPVYLVMTATPDASMTATGEPLPPSLLAAIPGGETPGMAGAGGPSALPAAVTPTPIQVNPFPVDGIASTETGAESSAPEAVVDVDLLVPTRRPTPVFDIPTSTPLAAAPVDTPTVTPQPLGTPFVNFAPAKLELMEDECTMVQWDVVNVREVYYENLPVNGQGEREECIDDHDAVYTLKVVLPTGVTEVYTTSVRYLAPTPTPTITPSFTPEPEFTPTWTPVPPTVTPTPDVTYATNLRINGAADLTCGAGTTCEAGLLVSNGGSDIDNLAVSLVAGGAFPVQLCRPDGVCSDGDLPINSVGPGNTAYITARISIPANVAGQSAAYSFQSFSEGSGRAVASGTVTVNISVP